MHHQKNILFLANRLPFPPNKGDKIRTFHQLEQLSLVHNVYCACFVDCARDEAHADQLKKWCKDALVVRWKKSAAFPRAAAALFNKSQPSLCISAYQSSQMRKNLAAWSSEIEFDVAVAFSSFMAPYALMVPAKRRVLDLCDVDSRKWSDYSRSSRWPLSSIYRCESRRLRQAERRFLDQFDATIVIAERERLMLDPDHSSQRMHVIPNGVTIEHDPAPPASRCGNVVTFIGDMAYKPNAEGICWFVKNVWPLVLKEIPEAKLNIVGRNPPSAVKMLAWTTGVSVTGEVDDVRSYLRATRVFVAPLMIARGLQNKVLEAMAFSRPVVATPAVVRGLDVEPDHNILVADRPWLFATKIVDLLRLDDYCDHIARAGFRCAVLRYSWTEALRDYEKVVLGEPLESTRSMPAEELIPQLRFPGKSFTSPRRTFAPRTVDGDLAPTEVRGLPMS